MRSEINTGDLQPEVTGSRSQSHRSTLTNRFKATCPPKPMPKALICQTWSMTCLSARLGSFRLLDDRENKNVASVARKKRSGLRDANAPHIAERPHAPAKPCHSRQCPRGPNMATVLGVNPQSAALLAGYGAVTTSAKGQSQI